MGTTLWVILVLLHSVVGDHIIDNENEEQRVISKKPGSAVPPNPQIINGQPAAPGQFPWQVRVIGQAPEGESLCGGSLIHPQWVLTAAHCIWLNGALLSNISVFLGSLVRPGFEPTRIKMDVPSVNVIKNSLYDESTVAWDAALIKLPFPAPMPTRNTNPVMINIVRLPPASMRRANLTGRMTTVSGWGWTSDPGNTSPMLRFTTGPIITLASCRSKLPRLTIHDHNMCTDIPRNQTSCQGDSGGPVVMQDNGRWLLMGVVSFGDPDSCLNGPSINVNVLSLLDWIRRTAAIGTTLWVILVLLHSVVGDHIIDNENEEQRVIRKKPDSAVPPNPQIINGQPAAPGQFPWQVRVIGQAPDGESLCGGSLIHPQWVLTAAHCIWYNGALLSNISVFLGSLVRPGFESTRIKMDVPSINVIKNSLYDEATTAWDAALIKLPFPAPMPTRTTNPVMINIVRLPPASMRRTNLTGRMTTVSGWGWTSDPGNTSPMLRFTTGPIITLASCRSRLLTLTIHDHNMCTDIPRNQTSCQGDSGGPVVMQDRGRWLLMGIVSFGEPSSCLFGPSVNVNVLSLLDWIRRTAGVT